MQATTMTLDLTPEMKREFGSGFRATLKNGQQLRVPLALMDKQTVADTESNRIEDAWTRRAAAYQRFVRSIARDEPPKGNKHQMLNTKIVDAADGLPLSAADKSKLRHILGMISANGTPAGIDNLHAMARRYRMAGELDSNPTSRSEYKRAADGLDGVIAALEGVI